MKYQTGQGRGFCLGVAAIGCVVYGFGAAGQEAGLADTEQGTRSVPILARDRLVGEWTGWRGRIEEQGLKLGGENVSEFSTVFDGGIHQKASFRNILTIEAEADLDRLAGVQGGSTYIQFLSVNAESGGSGDAGDFQGYSNIESAHSLDVIYELWYEQRLFNDKLRIKAGKIDANSEFSFVGAAGNFANSSAGFSPTVFAFPSYPDPATAVTVFGTVFDRDGVRVGLGYGLFDGAAAVDGVRTGTRGPSSFFSDKISDDCFHIGQLNVSWDRAGEEPLLMSIGRVSAGVWHHTGEFERFDSGTEDSSGGFFATGEVRLFGSSPRDDFATSDGVFVFGQYGWADEEVSEVGQHLAGGVVWRGVLPERADDSAGVYVTLADLSDKDGAGFRDNELAIDVYYRLQLAPAVFVQPELQFIVNPSGDPNADDAIVGGLRVGIAF